MLAIIRHYKLLAGVRTNVKRMAPCRKLPAQVRGPLHGVAHKMLILPAAGAGCGRHPLFSGTLEPPLSIEVEGVRPGQK